MTSDVMLENFLEIETSAHDLELGNAPVVISYLVRQKLAHQYRPWT